MNHVPAGSFHRRARAHCSAAECTASTTGSASAWRGKLFPPRRGVNSLLAATLVGATLLSGCIRPARAVRNLTAGEWTMRAGEPGAAPYADELVPDHVSVTWDEGFGRGLPSTPIVQDAVIIAVVSGGGIMTVSAETGERYWMRRFNGAVAGQALRIGSRIYLATQHRNGSVYALDITRGRRAFTRDLDARAVAEPAYAAGVLYVATDEPEVVAVSADHGGVLWRTRLRQAPAQAPIIAGDEVLVAAGDTLVRLNRSTGVRAGRSALNGVPSAPLSMRGDTIVVATHDGVVAAYVDRGRREVWRHDAGAPVLAAPVLTTHGAYVLNRNGEVHRIRGDTIERLAAPRGAATESLTIAANGILVGRLDGTLSFLDLAGRTVWQEQLRGSLQAPVAVRQGSIYAATLGGRMTRLAR